MSESHPGYEWEKGKAPRRVELPDLEGRPKFPPIPIGNGMSWAHQAYLDKKLKEAKKKRK